MKKNLPLLAPILTAVLAAGFLAPSDSGAKTVYDPVNGKTWSMRPPDAAASVPSPAVVVVSTAAPAAPPVPVAKSEPPPAEVRRKRIRHTANRARAVRVVRPPAISSGTAPAASDSQDSGGVPDYALDDIADRFEADESKFPLDRSTVAGEVTLRLVGLEKLPAMFVLKIAVDNFAGADFFVKGFTVKAGNQILSSRSVFRILVEPQQTREGYVLFEKPQAGTIVQIILTEDGGKGRSLETTIPYPF